MLNRYIRNIPTISQEENEHLREKKVCIVGCGGLGGYIIEMLARIGIENLTLVDGDVFDQSNLNRQLISNINNLGISKATEAQLRIQQINPNVKTKVYPYKLNKTNVENIFKNHDVVVDAVDNIPTRFLIQETCSNLNIPFVHGAIGGWFGQICTVFPGDNTLSKIYKNNKETKYQSMGNPSFTPALVASIQVSEVIKLLINRGELLRNTLLYIDTLENQWINISL